MSVDCFAVRSSPFHQVSPGVIVPQYSSSIASDKWSFFLLILIGLNDRSSNQAYRDLRTAVDAAAGDALWALGADREMLNRRGKMKWYLTLPKIDCIEATVSYNVNISDDGYTIQERNETSKDIIVYLFPESTKRKCVLTLEKYDGHDGTYYWGY